MDDMTPEQRRKTMQRIKSKDTKIEVALRKALWQKGIRYRNHLKDLPGSPDIAITKHRIAVFCDGEYFHGKDWEVLKPRLEAGNNPEYWIKKISGNIRRDREVDRQLLCMGWTVVRFWGTEIKQDPAQCVKVIEEIIFDQKLEQE